MVEQKDYTHGGDVYKASEELGIPKNKLIDFSANINPLGLSPYGIGGIIKGLKNILHYPDPNSIELIDSLSKYYNVNPNYILPGNGAIELIYQYVKIKPKGKALIPAPGFVEYEKALVSNGWEIELYNKKNINLNGIDVVFLCNPNNPTGYSYPDKFILNLLQECQKKKVDLFLDEAFIEYCTNSSMVKYLEDFNNLYILKSLTKFFAIPGLRLGMILTSNSEFNLLYHKNYIPWSINSIVQDYVKEALLDKKYINKSLNYMRKERVWFYRQLSKFSSIKTFRTQGNYIFFQYKGKLDLAQKLKKEGIIIRSCGNYNNLDNSFYRVAVKKHRENKRLLKSLSKWLKNG